MTQKRVEPASQQARVWEIPASQIFVVLLYVVIRGGLALNDTGFILVQATCPTSSFQSVGDFIPEPRWSKFAVGLQTSRNKKGVLKARSDSEPKDRE